MDHARLAHRGRMVVFGRTWWIPVVGATIAIAYDLAMFGVGTAGGVNLGLIGYLGGGVGGVVSGALKGTNWEDGMTVGIRAGGLSIVVVALVFAIGSFVVWYTATGIAFFYWSSFVGAIVFLVMAPIHAFTGAFGGVIGVVLRRFVLPRKYNPPAY